MFYNGEICLEDKDKIKRTNFMMFSTELQSICFASFLCFILLERKKLLAVLDSRCLILNEYIQWESISLPADNMAIFLFFQMIYFSTFEVYHMNELYDTFFLMVESSVMDHKVISGCNLVTFQLKYYKGTFTPRTITI